MAKREGIDREWLARAMHECYLRTRKDKHKVLTWEGMPELSRAAYIETADALAPLLEAHIWKTALIDLGPVA